MGKANLEKLLDYVIEKEASDLHVKTNRESIIRVKKRLVKVDVKVDSQDVVEFLEVHALDVIERFKELQKGKRYSMDAAINYKGRRFRLHGYLSINNVNLALRLLNETVPKLKDLNLPPGVGRFTDATSGLILVTGATGSGKTTTIASIIDDINKKRSECIVTIEDPIEYIFKEVNCTIEQREIGSHVKSFSDATVDVLREDPDIILIGEMRDLITVSNAITLAETGHLVFGTLHTKSVVDSIDRMIDIFPSEQQQQVKVQLASVLFGIVHQTLVSAKDGGVAVICEVLMMNDVLAGMLKTNTGGANRIRDYMRSRSEEGSVHVVDNIIWHIKEGRIKLTDVQNIVSAEDYNIIRSKLNYRA